MYANFDGMLHGQTIRYKVYRCIYGFSILPLMCWYGCRIFVMPAMQIWWTLKVQLSSDRVLCSIMQCHAVSCSDEMFARDFVCASECEHDWMTVSMCQWWCKWDVASVGSDMVAIATVAPFAMFTASWSSWCMWEYLLDGIEDVYMCTGWECMCDASLHGWCGKIGAEKAGKVQYSMHMQCEG
jgi:hypothetical protein